MRNNAAHLFPYHFQHLWYLLGRLGTRVQYNVKGWSSPRDRRYLQIACFETPIYMNFFRLKDFEFGKKNVHYIPDFLNVPQQTYSLNDLAG